MRRSRYAAGLANIIEHFGQANVLLFPFEALRAPAHMLAQIEQFLGIDAHDYEIGAPRNQSSAPKNKAVQSLIDGDSFAKRLLRPLLPRALKERIKGANRTKLKLSSADARYVYEQLRDDIEQTGHLVPFDINHWTRG